MQKVLGLKYDSKKERPEIICYECDQPGHVKTNCSKLNERSKKEKQRKAMVTTQSTGEKSSSESEDNINDVANVCLMARKVKS